MKSVFAARVYNAGVQIDVPTITNFILTKTYYSIVQVTYMIYVKNVYTFDWCLVLLNM